MNRFYLFSKLQHTLIRLLVTECLVWSLTKEQDISLVNKYVRSGNICYSVDTRNIKIFLPLLTRRGIISIIGEILPDYMYITYPQLTLVWFFYLGLWWPSAFHVQQKARPSEAWSWNWSCVKTNRSTKTKMFQRDPPFLF